MIFRFKLTLIYVRVSRQFDLLHRTFHLTLVYQEQHTRNSTVTSQRRASFSRPHRVTMSVRSGNVVFVQYVNDAITRMLYFDDKLVDLFNGNLSLLYFVLSQYLITSVPLPCRIITTVRLGQCGNQVGSKIFQAIGEEASTSPPHLKQHVGITREW